MLKNKPACVYCGKPVSRTGVIRCLACFRGRRNPHGKAEPHLATVRRLFFLRQRAEAGLPLFEEQERVNGD